MTCFIQNNKNFHRHFNRTERTFTALLNHQNYQIWFLNLQTLDCQNYFHELFLSVRILAENLKDLGLHQLILRLSLKKKISKKIKIFLTLYCFKRIHEKKEYNYQWMEIWSLLQNLTDLDILMFVLRLKSPCPEHPMLLHEVDLDDFPD